MPLPPTATYAQGAFPAQMVAIKPIGGLGARLKCIASFGVIADHFRVPLHVCWGASNGFEKIDVDELFDALPTNVRILDASSWGALRGGSVRQVVQLDAYVSYLKKDYRYSNYQLQELFQTRKPWRITAECVRDLQKLYGGVLHRFIPQFGSKYTEKLHAFTPCADVRSMVAREVNAWGENVHVLGVHFRRNDALQTAFTHRYATPSDSELMDAMDAQLARNTDDTSGELAYRVFVCTDDPNIYDDVHAKYGDDARVRCFPWKRYTQRDNASKHGQRKALVDLMTLRHCDSVRGSSFSAFYEIGKLRVREAVVGDDGDVAPSVDTFDDEPEPAWMVDERRQAEADAKAKAEADAKAKAKEEADAKAKAEADAKAKAEVEAKAKAKANVNAETIAPQSQQHVQPLPKTYHIKTLDEKRGLPRAQSL